MHNLLEFLNRFSHWFLFGILLGVSLFLLFRFNVYHHSVGVSSASALSGQILEGVSYVHSYIGLEEKNRQLAQHNLVLERRVEALQRLLDETSEDSVIEERFSDYTVIEARVVNATVRKRNNYITINKGESDGVRPEMGVVCGGGIVGIVYQVSSHYAIVMPVLNSQTAISCRLRGTDYFGYLRWDGGHPLYAYLGEIPRHAKVKVGMSVETSGFSEVFPAGLFVGKVCEVHNSEDGLSYTLKVNLSTDFSRLRDVFVLGNPAKNEIDSLESMVETER